MNDIIEVGDRILLSDGSLATIDDLDRSRGLYWVKNRMFYRYEFQPMKWEAPKVTSTGIGVCAQGAAGQ